MHVVQSSGIDGRVNEFVCGALRLTPLMVVSSYRVYRHAFLMVLSSYRVYGYVFLNGRARLVLLASSSDCTALTPSNVRGGFYSPRMQDQNQGM